MKTIPRILFIAAIAMIATAPAFAQANSQARIRQLIRVYYVPNPNVTTGEVFIDPVAFLNGSATPFQSATNANLAPFRTLLERLWGPATASREALGLQTVIAEILAIRNQRVAVYLIDDANTPVTNAAGQARWGITLGGDRTWPSGMAFNTQSFNANSGPAPDSAGGIFFGAFSMGNWNLLHHSQFARNDDEVQATFCHELMHTQDLIDWRTHLPGLSNLYGGASRGHLMNAAIPNMAMAYAEGLANFAGFRFAMYGSRATTINPNAAMTWFSGNEDLLVETAPQYGDLHTQMQSSGVVPVRQERIPGVIWNVYPIRSVPAPIRIHNEQIIGLILHHYAANVGFHRTMQTVARVSPQNYLVSTIPLSNLIGGLVNDATGDLRLLPIALVDYFTSYTAANPAAMRAILEGSLSGAADAEIDRYYASFRQQLLNAPGSARVNPAAPSAADIVNIARATGVRATPRD